MNTGFSPEVALLLHVCTLDSSAEKKGEITQFLDQNPIDWDRLNTLSDRHRLKPFLYRTLSHIPAVSDSFIATLRNDCRLAATDNLLKIHHHQELSDFLTKNNIAHVALKGIYLAEQNYPDSSLRITGDIDMLVHKDDVFTVVALLQANGYHLNQKQGLHWHQGEQKLLTDLFEISLFKPFFNGSHFDIDLHWKVLCFNQDYGLLDLNYVNSQPNGTTERMITLLIAHHGVANVWQQLYFINDLYFSLNNKAIDWPLLLEELQRFGFDQVFLAGVYWCQKIWALPVPDSIQELLASPRIHSLAHAYAKGWETDKPLEFSNLIVNQLVLLLKAQPQAVKKLKTCRTFLSSRVFRYSVFKLGKRYVYVPKELGFITLFIRATQSLARFLPVGR